MTSTTDDLGRQVPRAPRRGVVAQHLALALTVLAPLVWLPGGFFRFVLAKLLVSALAALTAVAATPVGRVPRRLLTVGLVGLAVLAAAALLGDTPLASLVGRWPRYEGLPTLGLYAAACWSGARVVRPGDPRLARAVTALAVVLAVLSVLDLAGVNVTGLPATGDDRSGSVLGNASDQGAVAMMAALLLLGRARRSPYALVGLVAALVTVGASGSRTALALTVLGVVVLSWRSRGVRVAAVAVVLLGLAAVLVPTTRHRLLDPATGRGRLEEWGPTLRLVLDHPLLGIGPSRFLDVFPGYESTRFVHFAGAEVLADSPHDVLLQVAVAGGVPLLAVACVGLVLTVHRGVTVVQDDASAAAVAVAVAAYVVSLGVTFTTAGPTCLAAFLLGSLVAEAPRAQEDGGARVVRWSLGVALAAAVATCVTACVGDVRLGRAVDAAEAGRARTAADEADAAHRWRPWDVDVRVIPAQSLAEQASLGNAAAAAATVRLADDALRRVPDSYAAQVALGVALLAQGHLRQAVSVLDGAVADAPRRPDAYVQRAIARYGVGDRAGARADLATAAGIDPGSPVVRRLRAEIGRGVG